MNVAVNTRLLLAHRMEGVARYIYETTKLMVLKHPDVQFHFLFDRPYDDQFVFSSNVKPHVIGPPTRHPVLWYLWFERSLPKFFKQYNIDVFYSGDMYLSLKSQIPTLMISHDLNYLHYPGGLRWSHLKFYEYYMPKYHNAANHIVTVSEATKYDVMDKYGIAESDISVAHNAVPGSMEDIPEERKIAIRDEFTNGAPYFVYVGSLHPRKNIERLLQAYDAFRNKYECDTKLLIYGRIAWKTDKIFSIYESLKYKSDVIFFGNEKLQVKEVIGAAEAMCYVSLFEGFGIPILEAFACGVPVITSNVSSMPEVAGDAALLVDPISIEDIVDKMIQLSSSDNLKSTLVEKGYLQLKKFSWDSSADLIFKQLEKLGSQRQF